MLFAGHCDPPRNNHPFWRPVMDWVYWTCVMKKWFFRVNNLKFGRSVTSTFYMQKYNPTCTVGIVSLTELSIKNIFNKNLVWMTIQTRSSLGKEDSGLKLIFLCSDGLKIFWQHDIVIPIVLYIWHKFTLQSTKLERSVDYSCNVWYTMTCVAYIVHCPMQTFISP